MNHAPNPNANPTQAMLADLLRMSNSPRAALEPLQANPTPTPTPTPTPLCLRLHSPPTRLLTLTLALALALTLTLALTAAGGVQARADPGAGEA